MAISFRRPVASAKVIAALVKLGRRTARRCFAFATT